MQDWDELRFFLSVAQTGSLTAASVKLGVNQSTVSRRINNFEQAMDVRLFERLTQGYKLTTEGEELLDRVLKIDDDIQAIDRHIMGKNVELSGPIRVTTSLAIARYILIPIFKKFNKQHPGIELHLDMSNSMYNLTQREADVAIRVTRDALPENLIGRELGTLEFGVYGEKKLVKAYTTKKHQSLHWIGEDNNDAHPAWLPKTIVASHLVMRSNEVLATYDAIQQGLGVGRLPTLLGDSDKNLVKLKFNNDIPTSSVWLLTHVDMRRVNRISTFTSFLVEEIRRKLNYVSR